MNYNIIFLLLLCLCCSIIFSNYQVPIVEGFGNIKWKREETCKYYLNQTLKDVLDKHGFDETKVDDYTLYFPCSYNNIKKEVLASSLANTSANQKFFIVNNADELSSKDHIWKNLVRTYGLSESSKIMPRSYILYQNEDMERFKKEYSRKKTYIMKKNIQRQEGLKITKRKKDILSGFNNQYVVAQELLQDPYTIDKRKTNMRFYLLLVCKNNKITAYVHDNGFVYYTKVPFKKNTTSTDINITTGYIDREVYKTNPLTLQDFREYLDKDRELSSEEINIFTSGNYLSEYAFNNCHKVLNKLVESIKHTVCVGSKLQYNTSFQLFGVDIAFNNKLDAQIIEVNKGPDLGKKDDRDGVIKTKVVEDILKVIHVIDSDDHDFKQIY